MSVHYSPGQRWKPQDEQEDEWGCVWDKLDGRVISSFGQVKEHLIKILKDYDSYQFPDPHVPGRFKAIDAQIEKYKDKYVVAEMGFHNFNRLMFLKGAEELFEDLVLNKDVLVNSLRNLWIGRSR